jgi:hypothetical protein
VRKNNFLKSGWVADTIIFGVINKVSVVWKTSLKRGDVAFADPIILPELTFFKVWAKRRQILLIVPGIF